MDWNCTCHHKLLKKILKFWILIKKCLPWNIKAQIVPVRKQIVFIDYPLVTSNLPLSVPVNGKPESSKF